MQDVLGNPIAVGDTVAWGITNKYSSQKLRVGVITDFIPKGSPQPTRWNPNGVTQWDEFKCRSKESTVRRRANEIVRVLEP